MSDIRTPRRWPTAVVWFRRDLRVHDHPALLDAVEHADHVYPLFVFDEPLLSGRWPAPNRISFMRDSAMELDGALRAMGSRLHVRLGRPAEAVAAFAREVGADAVLVSRDYGPYARSRDGEVAAALAEDGRTFHARRGLLVHEPEDVLTQGGERFSVYSPFRRAFERLERREPLAAPSRIPTPQDAAVGEWPSLARLTTGTPAAGLIAPGETAARERLAAWADGGLREYHARRNDLSADGTSRLSQDLHWGLLSGAEVYDRCGGPGRGPETFRNELTWREFYTHLLWHEPSVTREPLSPPYETAPWQDDPDGLSAWKDGRTGYPIVDACMRQVQELGWMHNRGRLIVASFLTKDLLIDYREGERHFMWHLTDGDLANNNGGWQWTASVGTDRQPIFRIFNPTLQATRFDPAGEFVRRWVPELAGVPRESIHEPWRMSPEVQERVGCVIGRDYPAPIVDHAQARARALDAFRS